MGYFILLIAANIGWIFWMLQSDAPVKHIIYTTCALTACIITGYFILCFNSTLTSEKTIEMLKINISNKEHLQQQIISDMQNTSITFASHELNIFNSVETPSVVTGQLYPTVTSLPVFSLIQDQYIKNADTLQSEIKKYNDEIASYNLNFECFPVNVFTLFNTQKSFEPKILK